MKDFINDRFLLTSDKASFLFDSYAKNLPIIDYHCHINPRDIAEDRAFTNLTELWLSGDHYKWRLMRANGIDEKYITGDADPKSKFIAWAKTIGKALGSPLYHWNCLELARYFGITEPLNEKNAEYIWDKTCSMMHSDQGKYTARGLIRSSKVEVICTTDDPSDDLKWHKLIGNADFFETKVLPSFRPDPILDIEKDTFNEYIDKLSEVSGEEIVDLNTLIRAIDQRIDFFDSMGCKIADHGMETITYDSALGIEVDKIFAKRKNGELTSEEISKYKTYILLHCARRYSELNWSMQLHFGCIRNVNADLKTKLGADCGCDSISGTYNFITPLSRLLSHLSQESKLPRTILYSLDPNNNALIDTLCGCYRNVLHGAAWWFNDNLNGMLDHMRSLSCQGFFPSFLGMLTDSRSFLSYTRHEYFRRILCSFVADQVNQGLFIDDNELLGEIITDICYNNSKALFS